MQALTPRGQWKLVTRSTRTNIVNCKWVFTMKHKSHGSMDRYKAHLVARGFTQMYGVKYEETFSPVARLNSIRVLPSVVNQS